MACGAAARRAAGLADIRAVKQTKSGLTHGEAPPGHAPHIVVRLKPGCRVEGNVIRSEKGRIDLGAVLPRGARMTPRVPNLAARRSQSLSAAEESLARTYQVLLPSRAQPAQVLGKLSKLECVEAAELSPVVSLP